MDLENRVRNQTVWRFLVLPLVFLTVVLLGGLRVGAEKQNFIFIAPPLVCLILASLLMLLFLRGRLVVFGDWISHDAPLLTNTANGLTLAALFAASAQALNSVLPERGLLFWLFAFFFLWTLWNNLFSEFDAKRLLRSLAVLFGTAFLLKHLILAAFAAPEESIWRRITGLILEGVSLGSLDIPNFAPLTGYISFFALALYVLGLVSLPFLSEAAPQENKIVRRIAGEIASLTPHEQDVLREQIARRHLPVEAEIIDAEEAG
ncbi:MAG TPA: hypothetical protein VEX64_02765 [Pyrinomonadaceae bacterium]|nr:hypothetical protein [Pyrinomonadaceae bacterium]